MEAKEIRLEKIDFHFLTEIIGFRGGPEFTQQSEEALVRLLEVPLERFRDIFLFHTPDTQLDGFIPVYFTCLFLNHDGWLGLDDRNRHSLAIFRKNLGHSPFFTNNSYFHDFTRFHETGILKQNRR